MFHFRNVQGDVIGGITAAVITVPMVLGFGVISGLGVGAGLWGAVFVGLFASLFGATPTLISQPTAPTTIIMLGAIASFRHIDPSNGLTIAFTVVMMAGLFQIILGSLKLGQYMITMPYTAIYGAIVAIGVIVMIVQTYPVWSDKNLWEEIFRDSFSNPNFSFRLNINPLEIILGVLTVVMLYILPHSWRKFFSPQLLALIVVTLVSVIFFWDGDINRLGLIKGSLPTFQFPTIADSQFLAMIIYALALGIVASLETLLTCSYTTNLIRIKHDPNRELIGQGLGNLFSGLGGGILGAGSVSTTVANVNIGSKTSLSALICAVILAILALWGLPLMANIPLTVLVIVTLFSPFV